MVAGKPEQQKISSSEVSVFAKKMELLRAEFRKAVIGQNEVVHRLILAMLSNGHVLLEGVPGIAKTLMVRVVSVTTGCNFKRIQFTPDLLPADLIGIVSYLPGKGFEVHKGPVFTNFLLADEVNRAPPKVQSALLECMQEKQATIGNTTYPIPHPFIVFATQNPLESLGTYQLPEAQIDRFFFKLLVKYPKFDEELEILHTNMTIQSFEHFGLHQVTTPEELLGFQELVGRVHINPSLEKYIVSLVDATRHPDKYNVQLGKYIEYGCSPRASIALFQASKVQALMDGRTYVVPDDVLAILHDTMRHRIILNYEGLAENVSTDQVLGELAKKVRVP